MKKNKVVIWLLNLFDFNKRERERIDKIYNQQNEAIRKNWEWCDEELNNLRKRRLKLEEYTTKNQP